jgi:hypothetical protein
METPKMAKRSSIRLIKTYYDIYLDFAELQVVQKTFQSSAY